MCLPPRLYRIGQVGTRPSARLGARNKWTKIGHRNAAKRLAATRAAVRDNVVARRGWLPNAAISGLKELDRGIEIVAIDSACGPDSHNRPLVIDLNNPRFVAGKLYALRRVGRGLSSRRQSRMALHEDDAVASASQYPRERAASFTTARPVQHAATQSRCISLATLDAVSFPLTWQAPPHRPRPMPDWALPSTASSPNPPS